MKKVNELAFTAMAIVGAVTVVDGGVTLGAILFIGGTVGLVVEILTEVN